MAEFYHKDDVVDNLWAEYEKTDLFKRSKEPLVGIPQDHPIIVRREEEGLSRIVSMLGNELSDVKVLYLKKLQDRASSEWASEWLTYNRILFERVHKICGVYRRKEVWFDTIDASENDYKIPNSLLVPSRIAELADTVRALLNETHDELEAKVAVMAKIHFEFIRIHPFADGNGRIGRMIIDQLCLAFSLPTVMGGYPRADLKQRRAYHSAIKDCCYDPDCKKLIQWITSKLEDNAKLLA